MEETNGVGLGQKVQIRSVGSDSPKDGSKRSLQISCRSICKLKSKLRIENYLIFSYFQIVQNYPFVSKTIKDSFKNPEERKHCCGMTIQNEGIGYPELDELFRNPCDLIFTIEILSVELPNEYEKESWQLEESEKMESVESYRLRGNEMYKENLVQEAAENYAFAMGILEQLMLK